MVFCFCTLISCRNDIEDKIDENMKIDKLLISVNTGDATDPIVEEFRKIGWYYVRCTKQLNSEAIDTNLVIDIIVWGSKKLKYANMIAIFSYSANDSYWNKVNSIDANMLLVAGIDRSEQDFWQSPGRIYHNCIDWHKFEQ